ncbi:hypothetical protein SH580_06105 [Coraliomargarita algicola]|uniref:Uncharacterized protein n=1 Tax=Coraliomargarita algicola TaxID=3092156 RepID=A0ABZ0RWA3_9BACT|nr:hypothetical protein [Coraliomargarita sp. J2-16]WPJ97279.1 hypothetical protein SH580_06105 [Coraliomargarita sp. J2-16]
MKNLNRLILLIALCLPLFTQVFAAQLEAGASGLKFTCLIWDRLPMQELYYKDGQSYQLITFRKGKRSQDYPLKKSEVFELYVPDVNAASEPSYKLVGATPLVAGTQEMLFIIMSAEAESEMPLSIISLDDSLAGFPPGSFQFSNFTDSALLVKVRNELTELESGQTATVSAQSLDDDGMVPVTFTSLAGELLQFNRFYAHTRSRELVLIRKSKNTRKPLEFKFIPQSVPAQR